MPIGEGSTAQHLLELRRVNRGPHQAAHNNSERVHISHI